MRRRYLAGSMTLLVLIAATWGCNEQAPPASREVAVAFEYLQQHQPAGPENPNWTYCVHSYALDDLVLSTSWGASETLEPAGERRFGARLEAVPSDEAQWVMLHDITLCDVDADREPVVTRGLSANGVELTRVIQVDGHPALGFAVAPDGTVEP